MPARADGRAAAPPPPLPASVAELQLAHDRALLRVLAAYIAAKPKAEDLDQAYLALFDKVIEHDWFAEYEEPARRYLASFPDGPVRALAQIVATMARRRRAVRRGTQAVPGADERPGQARAGRVRRPVHRLARPGRQYGRRLRRRAPGLRELLQRYGESPTLRQKVRDDLNRLAMVGKPAPRLVVKDVEGNTFRLEDLRGTLRPGRFLGDLVRPCVAELPRVQAAFAKYREAGFEVVGVSLDETKIAVVDFARTRKLPWRQIHNASCGGDLVEAFGVGSIPATFLLDPQGTVIRLELRGPALDQALAQLIKNPAVPRIGARR